MELISPHHASHHAPPSFHLHTPQQVARIRQATSTSSTNTNTSSSIGTTYQSTNNNLILSHNNNNAALPQTTASLKRSLQAYLAPQSYNMYWQTLTDFIARKCDKLELDRILTDNLDLCAIKIHNELIRNINGAGQKIIKASDKRKERWKRKIMAAFHANEKQRICTSRQKKEKPLPPPPLINPAATSFPHLPLAAETLTVPDLLVVKARMEQIAIASGLNGVTDPAAKYLLAAVETFLTSQYMGFKSRAFGRVPTLSDCYVNFRLCDRSITPSAAEVVAARLNEDSVFALDGDRLLDWDLSAS